MCVRVWVSVCLVVGRCCPSPSLIMLITQTGWAVFALGTDCCSFSIFNPPFFSSPFILLIPLSLSFSHQTPPTPTPNPNSPCASHPLRRWERERERQRETGQACTVENIVYARHKAACNFCSRGDTHKGWEGERGGARGRAEMGRKSSRIKTTTDCDQIS